METQHSSKYDISVLLPTRGRTTALTRSVISLINRVRDTSRIELLLGFDTDDEIGIKHWKEELKPLLDQRGVHYTALSFHPMGYIRLHDYVTELAKKSDAAWFLFWNDDAVMESQNWDQEIMKYQGQFKVLAVHTHRDHPYSIFPIVPREWLDILGYLSPHQMNDAWISQVAYMLDIWERIPVWVEHDRFDLTGNNYDETFKHRPQLEGNPLDPRDFHSEPCRIRRLEDTEKISNYLKSKGVDQTWWENIKANKQDPWQKLVENDVNKQTQQGTVPMFTNLPTNKQTETAMSSLYNYNYFTVSDGQASWHAGCLKFGDAFAALCYAYGLSWDDMAQGFTAIFNTDSEGRQENHGVKIGEQIKFLNENKKRTPKTVLEIGGGRGEVSCALTKLGVDVTSIEPGEGASKWYADTAQKFFPEDQLSCNLINSGLERATPTLDFKKFDTIIMVESIEHIKAEDFAPFWDRVVKEFKGRFIITNWLSYHPIAVGEYASAAEHCRLVDDALYDSMIAQATKCIARKQSHLVLEF